MVRSKKKTRGLGGKGRLEYLHSFLGLRSAH